MRKVIVLAALAALFAAVVMAGTASAKGPKSFHAEISGPGLASPVAIEGEVTAEAVFENDALAVPAPASLEQAYTITLVPAEPDAETGEFMLILTYFPGDGEKPGLLSGDWDNDRYFRATSEFESIFAGAIKAAASENDDGVGAVWYIAPSLALGVVLISGFAGRRLLMRRNGHRPGE